MEKLGLKIPSILLPDPSVDLQKWAVIACDQFTQDRGYWEKAEVLAGESPSTLSLIFPEVFLDDADAKSGGAPQRIENIHLTMRRFLQEGVFAQGRRGFVYIERDTPYHKKRRGLLTAIDLEQYEWRPQARPLIRCTEGTVPERLPPRMDIRRGASLELPHVILLIDDEEDALLPSIGEKVKNTAPCYSTQLMMESGGITGWFLDNGQLADNNEKITGMFSALYDRSLTRYPGNDKPFLFAVGDGNHSLAAAKGVWEEIKSAHRGQCLPDHPCRYALVEIENIYDPAIQFEPIHRLVFDAGYDKTIDILSALPAFKLSETGGREELAKIVSQSGKEGNCFGVISEGRRALIETSAAGIATACLQPLLDKYAQDMRLLSGTAPQLIDYIHDEKELFRLMETSGRGAEGGRIATGILLPPVQKSGLFETVARLGPLPRKSFSMGHSVEKRFYIECRSLVP